LPVVIYGGEIWSVITREKHNLRVFEHIQFWRLNLRIRDHLEDPNRDRRIIFTCICKKWDWGGME
jgi:hypothetical protein